MKTILIFLFFIFCVGMSNLTLSATCDSIVIKEQPPYKQIVNIGQTVILSVTSNGSNPQFQWYRNGEIMTGETLNTLVIKHVVRENDNCYYYCHITNDCSTKTTQRSVLKVNIPCTNLLDMKSTNKKINEVYELFNDSNQLVTNSYIDKMFYKIQNSISGTNIREGKVAGTNITVDEKSLNASIFLNFLRHKTFYSQISTSATSDDGVVNILSNSKLTKNYALGYNFNWFPQINTADYNKEKAIELHFKLALTDSCFECYNLSQKLDSIVDYIDNCCKYFKTSKLLDLGKINCEKCSDIQIIKFQKDLKIVQNFFKETLFELPCADLSKLIKDNIDCIILQYCSESRLNKLDSIQNLASWNRINYYWFSGSFKLNNKNYLILDTVQFTKGTYYDNYLTASFSFNRLWQNRKYKFNTLISPSIYYQNSKDFKSDDLQKFEGTRSLNGSPNYYQITDDGSVYFSIPRIRTTTFKLEFPIQWYLIKLKSGFDLMIGSQLAFPTSNLGYSEINNVYGKLGFYFPITISDKVIVIEPLIKINQLQKEHLIFFKDQFSFGINLSLSLPSYLRE